MKVSVITVCWNSEGTISAAMESVLAQQGVEVEYIVVDGGSTDGTVERIKEYEAKFGGRMRWKSERDEGMYDAINKGIAMASGDIVGILNADDVFESEGELEKIASAFEHGVEAVYADVRFVKDDLNTTVRYYSAKHWRPWMLQWGKMPPHPSVYIRRELFGKLGLYKLGYDIAADYELLVRYLRKAKLKTAYLDECVVRMRMGGKSTRGWKSNWRLNREIVRGNRENGYWCTMAMLAPKYAFKIFEFILPRLGFNRKGTRG